MARRSAKPRCAQRHASRLGSPVSAHYTACMTNALALWLIALIVAFFALDYLVLQWDTPLFLARKFYDLLQWVAFWR